MDSTNAAYSLSANANDDARKALVALAGQQVSEISAEKRILDAIHAKVHDVAKEINESDIDNSKGLRTMDQTFISIMRDLGTRTCCHTYALHS